MQLQLTLTGRRGKSSDQPCFRFALSFDKQRPDRDNSPQLLAGDSREGISLARYAQLQLKNNAAARADFEAARQSPIQTIRLFTTVSRWCRSPRTNRRTHSIRFETALKVDATNFDALNGLITLYARNKSSTRPTRGSIRHSASYPNNASLHYLKAAGFGFQQNAQSRRSRVEEIAGARSELPAGLLRARKLSTSIKAGRSCDCEYQKIIALRPDNATPYTMIGMLEDQRKNYDAAAENYRKALEKDPNSIIAANNLAWLYAVTGKGNLDEALRLAQGVVQKNPNVAGFIDTLGLGLLQEEPSYAASSNCAKPYRLTKQARTANISPSASYHYHLGMALKGKGDKDGSRRELETAIRLPRSLRLQMSKKRRRRWRLCKAV
jgi:tetratricopeptide (TPR) repeat protein